MSCNTEVRVYSTVYCNVDMYNITIWNELMVCSKRYDFHICLVLNSRTLMDKFGILNLKILAVTPNFCFKMSAN